MRILKLNELEKIEKLLGVKLNKHQIFEVTKYINENAKFTTDGKSYIINDLLIKSIILGLIENPTDKYFQDLKIRFENRLSETEVEIFLEKIGKDKNLPISILNTLSTKFSSYVGYGDFLRTITSNEYKFDLSQSGNILDEFKNYYNSLKSENGKNKKIPEKLLNDLFLYTPGTESGVSVGRAELFLILVCNEYKNSTSGGDLVNQKNRGIEIKAGQSARLGNVASDGKITTRNKFKDIIESKIKSKFSNGSLADSVFLEFSNWEIKTKYGNPYSKNWKEPDDKLWNWTTPSQNMYMQRLFIEWNKFCDTIKTIDNKDIKLDKYKLTLDDAESVIEDMYRYHFNYNNTKTFKQAGAKLTNSFLTTLMSTKGSDENLLSIAQYICATQLFIYNKNIPIDELIYIQNHKNPKGEYIVLNDNDFKGDITNNIKKLKIILPSHTNSAVRGINVGIDGIL